MDHPVVPPQELLSKWRKAHLYTVCDLTDLFIEAAQCGADQELEACCEVLARELICDGKHVATDLRTVRRFKPPSLKEQALNELDALENMGTCNSEAICCAVEALPDEQ